MVTTRPMAAVASAVVLIHVWACQTALPPPRLARQVEAVCTPETGEQLLLSDAVAAYGTERANRIVAGEWERLLVAADLAPLWCGPGPDEAYRLIFQPAHARALVVQVSRNASTWDVTTIRFRDPRVMPLPHALDDRFTAEERQTRPLASAEADALLAALRDLNYWTVAASSHRDADDGARWAIEGRDQRSYRIVVRINADDQKFEEVARLFVRLAGETVPREMRSVTR